MLIEPQWIVLGGVAALTAGGVLFARAAERKRREALEGFCLMRGFRFEPERPGAEAALAALFEPFRSGHSRKWGYTLTGVVGGRPITAFEYRWVTGGGKNSHRHAVHAILWETPDGRLPAFTLGPENLLTRLAGVFGAQDIDFADSPEFSRAYRLRGEDEAAIRAFLTPALRQFLTLTPGQQIAAAGTRFLWWRAGRLPKPEQLEQFLMEGDALARRFL
ncbi:MAG TPA: hypothetical protein VGQ25_02240 [Gemmatimonadales bacterium]|jgi:hypothetical protein|nr:hypothetical protein [Gemmatimonadales bacterium]